MGRTTRSPGSFRDLGRFELGRVLCSISALDVSRYCLSHSLLDEMAEPLLTSGEVLVTVGRTYARTDVILLVQDLHVTVIDASTGEILRDLIIDPRRDYQPTGHPTHRPEN